MPGKIKDVENVKNMTIWFFGDSWPAGCELEPTQGPEQPYIDRPDLAFPAMVSQRLGCKTVTKAVSGSSQQRLVEHFLDSEISSGDLAIFCLTSRNRRTYKNFNADLVEIMFDNHPLRVNAYENDRISSQVCTLLYLLCESKNIMSYFFNLFDTPKYPDRLGGIIPEDRWFIPRSHSVLSWAFDPVYFSQYADHNDGNFREWLATDCPRVKRYIRPCYEHPNFEGHGVIADLICAELIKRKHF